jgi:uncharacterized protein YecT (DUF1311 family)
LPTRVCSGWPQYSDDDSKTLATAETKAVRPLNKYNFLFNPIVSRIFKVSEVLTEARAEQVKFSEIVISEGREPLTNGSCRIVMPISRQLIRDPAVNGRLTFLEFCIAKIFEITIYDSSSSGECVNGIGSSDKLTWSIFVGDYEGSKDGQNWIGNYFIPRKLACEVAEEYGLSKSESTLLNNVGVGTTQVDIPILGIFGDAKISKWKQFVDIFLQSNEIKDDTNSDSIDQELDDCLSKIGFPKDSYVCFDNAYDQWNKELNRIYQILIKQQEDNGQEELIAAESMWIKYRDKEFKLIDRIYPEEETGKIQKLSRKVELVRTRCLELRRYVETN